MGNSEREQKIANHPLSNDESGWGREAKYVLETLENLQNTVREIKDEQTKFRVDLAVLVTKMMFIGAIATVTSGAISSIVVTLLLKVVMK